MDESLDKILEMIDAIGIPPGELLKYLAMAVVLLALLLVVRRILGRRLREQRGPSPDLAVDIASLMDVGPPAEPPTLEFYHLPVRLAAVVLAPVGRLRELPPPEELPELIDSIVPGLEQVVRAHRPLIRAWPRQVSPRGFAHAFFANVRLPGDHGKKTPWCSVAGMFKADDQPMMAGLVMRTDTPNRHGQYVMEQEEQWLGIMRVRL